MYISSEKVNECSKGKNSRAIHRFDIMQKATMSCVLGAGIWVIYVARSQVCGDRIGHVQVNHPLVVLFSQSCTT